ncbi:membrane hypothetical protein [uncultured Desulfatiglans sp.]|nr:membrane hypothetical protein [uncultured Desulfatiglans sp.]
MGTDIASRIHLVFNDQRTRTVLTSLRYPIAFALFILTLPHMRSDLLFPGFLVSLLGESIQVWSFASLDKNKTLAFRGPYSLTRNPMYIGRFFLLLGIMLTIGKIVILISYVILYYFYMINRVKREETRLLLIFRDEYQVYCDKIKRFIPSFKYATLESTIYFRWNLFIQNNGHWNLMIFISIYISFYFFMLFKASF